MIFNYHIELLLMLSIAHFLLLDCPAVEDGELPETDDRGALSSLLSQDDYRVVFKAALILVRPNDGGVWDFLWGQVNDIPFHQLVRWS